MCFASFVSRALGVPLRSIDRAIDSWSLSKRFYSHSAISTLLHIFPHFRTFLSIFRYHTNSYLCHLVHEISVKCTNRDGLSSGDAMTSANALTLRNRHSTSSVLQVEMSSRASLRDNFLDIAAAHGRGKKNCRTCTFTARRHLLQLFATMQPLTSPPIVLFVALSPRPLSSIALHGHHPRGSQRPSARLVTFSWCTCVHQVCLEWDALCKNYYALVYIFIFTFIQNVKIDIKTFVISCNSHNFNFNVRF